MQSIRNQDKEAKHEIIISGPHKASYDKYNVKYLDQSQFRDEQFAEISKKKNAIAQMASNPNLLIAHDRFYLDKDIPAHLPDLYVINILPYDLFGKDYMLYHIQNSCREIPELDYPDGLQYLYFNTQGTKGGNPELRLLLDFMQESTEANARTPLLQALYRHVYTLRQRPDLYINYEYFKADVSFAQNELKEKRTARRYAMEIVEEEA